MAGRGPWQRDLGLPLQGGVDLESLDRFWPRWFQVPVGHLHRVPAGRCFLLKWGGRWSGQEARREGVHPERAQPGLRGAPAFEEEWEGRVAGHGRGKPGECGPGSPRRVWPPVPDASGRGGEDRTRTVALALRPGPFASDILALHLAP